MKPVNYNDIFIMSRHLPNFITDKVPYSKIFRQDNCKEITGTKPVSKDNRRLAMPVYREASLRFLLSCTETETGIETMT